MDRPHPDTREQSNLPSQPPQIYVASGNAGKLEEFRLGLRLWQVERQDFRKWAVALIPGMDAFPACEEDGETFSANARKKAMHYSRFVSGLVLGDDSGLEVDALQGAPGVRSRRFAGPAATDEENNAKLLHLLRGVVTPERAAQFVCVLALAQESKVLAEFRGSVRGVITDSPRGASGFGYDPLFLHPASGKTFGELPPPEKWRCSHRGQAMRALLQWLAEQFPASIRDE